MADELTPITSFKDEYRFLSNFWPATVLFENILYPTVEHAYVAAKTLDRTTRLGIAAISTPGKVKRVGRSLELRPDWELVKLTVMEDLLELKFMHADLRRMLQATAPRELIEGNTWGDTFWGVCDGVGENHLGKLLTKTRDAFPPCAMESLK